MRLTTASTPGFCRPMAFSMPMGVSAMRWGSLPSRGCSVVPLRHDRAGVPVREAGHPCVFFAEPDAARQQDDGRREGEPAERGGEQAGIGGGGWRHGCVQSDSVSPGDPSEHGQHHTPLRQHGDRAAPGEAARASPWRTRNCAGRGSTTTNGPRCGSTTASTTASSASASRGSSPSPPGARGTTRTRSSPGATRFCWGRKAAGCRPTCWPRCPRSRCCASRCGPGRAA